MTIDDLGITRSPAGGRRPPRGLPRRKEDSDMTTDGLCAAVRALRTKLSGQVASRLGAVLAPASRERREFPGDAGLLERQVGALGEGSVVGRAAYVWFNRLCALRYMDVRGYAPVRAVSPAEGETLPEILAEAKRGRFDASVPEEVRRSVADLLDGGEADAQDKAYRLLLASVCDGWRRAMPFLFHGDDAGPLMLLMPEDLLSPASVTVDVREIMTEGRCGSVEIVGWLYQHYASERKDEVFEGYRKGRKAETPEDVCAATQLFTPDWIVRYLTENSLGRLRMRGHAGSALAGGMRYYVPDEGPVPGDAVDVADVRVLDPACGSGHILTYAFDLLTRMYEEDLYDDREAVRLILGRNLWGADIDERCCELAAFALLMKAEEHSPGYLRSGDVVVPHVVHLHDVAFSGEELARCEAAARAAGPSSLEAAGTAGRVRRTLGAFSRAGLLGSLLRCDAPTLESLRTVRGRVVSDGTLGTESLRHRLDEALGMAEVLARRYDVVAANPPYMGGRAQNAELKEFLKREYPDGKDDLFAAFMARDLELAKPGGLVAMVTMQSWMFLSSYERLRERLLGRTTLLTMAHVGARGFDAIGGEVVQTTAFVCSSGEVPGYRGGYVRLVDGGSAEEKERSLLEAVANPSCGWFHRADQRDFASIPGSPVAYWVSDRVRRIFAENGRLGDVAEAKQGLATADNNRFLRLWFEVGHARIGFGMGSREQARASGLRWFPCNKGGSFRKWYGNQDYVVNWENDGEELFEFKPRAVIRNPNYYFRESVSWSDVTSSATGFRYYPQGFIFNNVGHSIFGGDYAWKNDQLCYLNLHFTEFAIKLSNPTLHFEVGDLNKLPYIADFKNDATPLISIARADWDNYETSWDFKTFPLLRPEHRRPTVAESYASVRAEWRAMTEETRRLEVESNRLFNEACGLQDEIPSDVPLREITLTCNPWYRYGVDEEACRAQGEEALGRKAAELEERLLGDTMRELVSYAVGCIVGRYSPDAPGLVLADADATGEDHERIVRERGGEPSFRPDGDGVVPMVEGGWFADGVAERFSAFLKATFGEERYAENLRFVERGLGRPVGEYLTRDFFDDHARTYRGRPIYWVFSDPTRSFNALVYLHRWRRDTVGAVLTLLREYQARLEAERTRLEERKGDGEARGQALKAGLWLGRTLDSLRRYEGDVLYPLASERVRLDLDDGVRANYARMGQAVRKLRGLKEE